MPIVVIALAEDEFESWVSEQLAEKSQNDQQVTAR
jgi:heme/copper-type cytochrome/quinol oxidase subunit 2